MHPQKKAPARCSPVCLQRDVDLHRSFDTCMLEVSVGLVVCMHAFPSNKKMCLLASWCVTKMQLCGMHATCTLQSSSKLCTQDRADLSCPKHQPTCCFVGCLNLSLRPHRQLSSLTQRQKQRLGFQRCLPAKLHLKTADRRRFAGPSLHNFPVLCHALYCLLCQAGTAASHDATSTTHSISHF